MCCLEWGKIIVVKVLNGFIFVDEIFQLLSLRFIQRRFQPWFCNSIGILLLVCFAFGIFFHKRIWYLIIIKNTTKPLYKINQNHKCKEWSSPDGKKIAGISKLQQKMRKKNIFKCPEVTSHPLQRWKSFIRAYCFWIFKWMNKNMKNMNIQKY